VRLDDRVRRLQTHFGQANKDIDDILVSSSKVTKRGQKIEALEFAEAPVGDPVKDTETARSAASATGQLRLRVVEGDD
jgi:DNA recombination protein RmuC